MDTTHKQKSSVFDSTSGEREGSKTQKLNSNGITTMHSFLLPQLPKALGIRGRMTLLLIKRPEAK